MKKVIFIYESHSDQSAAQVLKELLGKINGNVSLCLEMPEQNIKATLVKEANNRAGIVWDFKTLKNKTLVEKIEYVSRWLTANQDRVTLTVKSTGVVELSSSELDQIIDEIIGRNLGTYNSLSATLDSVELAESKGMKVCAIDQPYNERADVGPLSCGPRDRYVADKLTKLCNETEGTVLFLVGLNHYSIAEMIRNNGILTAEYYIRTNIEDLSPIPSSINPMAINSDQDIVSSIIRDSQLLVSEVVQIEVEESKQESLEQVSIVKEPVQLSPTPSETRGITEAIMPTPSIDPPAEVYSLGSIVLLGAASLVGGAVLAGSLASVECAESVIVD